VTASRVIAWISAQVLPHEPDVRAWLRSRSLASVDEDDVIQEAYCRMAALEDVAHIQSGRAYFFTVVRNVVLEQIRRARVIRIEATAEIERLNIPDSAPSPERAASGQSELAWVQLLIGTLPRTCRQIFTLRKVHAMSQREIARQLGVTENTVEKQTARGLRLLMKALTELPGNADQRCVSGHARKESYERARTRR
jgi:RNA polymerase sigma factor (sigma-70 family)